MLARASAGQIRGRIKENVARPALADLAEHAPEWLAKMTVREVTRIDAGSGNPEAAATEMPSRSRPFTR